MLRDRTRGESLALCEQADELAAFGRTNPKGAKLLEPLYATLERFKRQGRYDRAKALKLAVRDARELARAYCAEYAPNRAYPVMFPPLSRELWAHNELAYFESEIAAGNSWLGKGE